MFIHRDIEVLEINPLILTEDDNFMVAHAEAKLDSNSLFR